MSTKNTLADLDERIQGLIDVFYELDGYYVSLDDSHLKPNVLCYPQAGGTRRD